MQRTATCKHFVTNALQIYRLIIAFFCLGVNTFLLFLPFHQKAGRKNQHLAQIAPNGCGNMPQTPLPRGILCRQIRRAERGQLCSPSANDDATLVMRGMRRVMLALEVSANEGYRRRTEHHAPKGQHHAALGGTSLPDESKFEGQIGVCRGVQMKEISPSVTHSRATSL